MNICFATVIYMDGLKFWNEFIDSLKRQTYDDFTLVLLNQDVIDLSFIKDIHDINIIAIGPKIETHSACNTFYFLKEVKKLKFDLVIFGDLDDIFEEKRIEKMVKQIKNYDFCVHDLKVIDRDNKIIKKSLFSSRIKNMQVNSFEQIQNYNFIGLSNSAMNLSKIDLSVFDEILDCNKVVAADWLLYSILLIEGYKGIYLDDPLTLYKQHDNNTIGVQKNYKENIEKAYNVKLKHFKSLYELYKYDFLDKLYNYYNQKFSAFKNYGQKDKNISNLFWWETGDLFFNE